MNGKSLQLLSTVRLPSIFFVTVLAALTVSVSIHVSAFPVGQSPAGVMEQRGFNIHNATIPEAVTQILTGTEYRIVYSVNDLEAIGRVSLQLANATPIEALNTLLQQYGLKYSMQDSMTMVISGNLSQQQPLLFEVSGIVLDENGKPIAGAAVMLPDGSKGTITDAQGRFSYLFPRGQIIITFIGMKSQTIEITKPTNNLVITLKQSISKIEQIVVTGYSTMSMERTPGSVAVLTQEDLQDAPLQSLDMLLQGKMAGVHVQAESGRPGESAKIRIRGTNTLTGNASPLWVLNGVPLLTEAPTIPTTAIKSGDFSTLFIDGIAGINPEDIESVTVLKDASAAAIYGARAAGGVIVVTTKKGEAGKMKANYSGSISLTTRPIRTMDLMTSAEKLQFEQELWEEFSLPNLIYNADPSNPDKKFVPYIGITGIVRGSGYPRYNDSSTSAFDPYLNMTDAERDAYLESLAANTTDWFDELFRTSISYKHHLSLSGGNDLSTYYVSVGYEHQNGLLKQNSMDSYHMNSTIGAKIGKKASIDFITNISYIENREPSQATNVFQYAYYANPYEQPYNEDGSYRGDQTYHILRSINIYDGYSYPEEGINILRELNETSLKTKNMSVSENIKLNWQLTNDLSFTGTAAADYANHNSEGINGPETYTAFNDRPFDISDQTSQRRYGSITNTASYSLSYTLRGQFNFSKLYNDKHYVNAFAGAEITSSYMKTIYSKKYGYDPVTGGSSTPSPLMPSSGSVSQQDLINLATLMAGLSGQRFNEQALASFYVDVDYTFDRRYTVKVSGRTDGSNNFGQKRQFNPIWSAGVSWNVLQERFGAGMESIFSRFIVRVSSGYTGNINKTVYPQLVMTYQSSYRPSDDEILRMGVVSSAPNPSLSWERTFDYKFNIDLGFFNDRLTVSSDYYNRTGSRLVTTEAVTYTTGFREQSYNTSKIRNTGVELTLGVRILNGDDYSLSFTVNGAYNRNRVLEYNPPNKNYNNAYYVGYPVDGFFAGESRGINPYTGLYEFEPRSDAVFTSDADYNRAQNFLVYLGTKTAPYTGGFGVSGSYRNFRFAMSGNYAIGNIFVDNTSPPGGYTMLVPATGTTLPQTSNQDLYAMHFNVLRDVANRWTSDNPITDGNPRIIDVMAGEKIGNRTQTTVKNIVQGALAEEVSYIKFSSISLSYELGKKILMKLRLRSMNVSFLMNNLFTISSYSGIDPESPGALYPQSKSFSLALRVGF